MQTDGARLVIFGSGHVLLIVPEQTPQLPGTSYSKLAEELSSVLPAVGDDKVVLGKVLEDLLKYSSSQTSLAISAGI